MLALEGTMDELANVLGTEPIGSRLHDTPERNPERDVPFSARGLAEALTKGAERFGRSERRALATRREWEWRIGMGVASRPARLS